MGIVDNMEGNKKLIYSTTRYKEEKKKKLPEYKEQTI